MHERAAQLRETPFALTVSVAGGLRIAAANEAASRVGVEPGQKLADARALYPELIAGEADPRAEEEALTALADWLGRYTPWTVPSTRSSGGHNGREGVFLDITGCAHLFGGEAGLLEDLMAHLRRFHITARAALADSPGAAWAVAHFAQLPPQGFHIVPEGGQRQALAHLPVAGLRLTEEIVLGLQAMGLKTIHQLYDLPRAPLTARFGTDVAHRLDQALGIDEEPISPRQPLVPYRVRKVLAEPISTQDAVAEGIRRLTEDLAHRLKQDRQGARRLVLTLYRVDGKLMRLVVGTAQPTHDPAHMTRLLAEKLDRLSEDFDAGFGIDVMMLAAPRVEDKTPAQESLGLAAPPVSPVPSVPSVPSAPSGSAAASTTTGKSKAYPTFTAELSALLDRLGNRFGPEEVYQVAPRASHIPERAQERLGVFALEARRPAEPWSRSDAARLLRPLTLLARPEPIEVIAEVPDGPPRRFRWRRVTYQVLRTLGPERIAPEWWQLEPQEGDTALATRDYFQAEDEDGRRFWLFRNGLYDRESEKPEWCVPQWFVHGVFG